MQSYRITVEGMTCDNCRKRVERIIKGVEGVSDAQVVLADRSAVVSGAAVPLDAVKGAIEKAGYKVTGVVA